MIVRPGFCVNGLVRHTSERGSDALERHRHDGQARTVLIAGDVPILRVTPGGRTSLHPAGVAGDLPVREEAFLGTFDGVPVLAALVDAAAAESFSEREGFQVLDLRSIAVQGLVPEPELGMLAEAKSLLGWHARHRFCANCGAPTRPTCSGFRRDCAACGAQHFPRTDPVVIMLVTHGDRCLLGRQARFVQGSYSCLAGFVEPGETIEDAVRRETFEEAGVRVGEVRYVTSQPWPFPSSLMIGCAAEALDDGLTIDREELEDARWFGRDEVRAMVAGTHPEGLIVPPRIAIARILVEDWITN
jgi:NAD+ diphosphatase